MITLPRSVLAYIALAMLGGCDRERDPRERTREPVRERRVIEPPAGVVRLLPPHLIRNDSVGPFKLGERLTSLLEQLPSGPRIAIFEVSGILHRSVIRAEDGKVLVGGEPSGTASFIAVTDPEIARTEGGIHVGSTRDEVEAQLGPLVDSRDRVFDPRVLVPSKMPNTRIVLDNDRVQAIVVTDDAITPSASESTDCARPASTADAFGACLTGAGELVAIDGNEIVVRTPDNERAFRIPSNEVAFAAPLRMRDGRDELIVITHTGDDQRRWALHAFRYDGGKFVQTIQPAPLFQLSAANARWIGTELRDIELFLEVANRVDAIEVGGFLTTRATPGKARDLVMISPISVPRRSGKSSAPEASDAGIDAPVEQRDAASAGAAPAKR